MKRPQAILDNDRDTSRLEAFSDGVFAVAITLLVLNIQVPHVSDHDSLLTGLGNSLSSYLGYVTSFLLIGLFWANHHYLFKYVMRTDHFLLLLNILLLMCVVLIPFATELLTAYIHSGDNSYIAAMLYCGTILLTSIMYNLLWYYASVHYRLVDNNIPLDVLQQMSRRYLISLPLYVFTLIVGRISVEACLVLNIIIALVYALPATLFQRVSLRPGRMQVSHAGGDKDANENMKAN